MNITIKYFASVREALKQDTLTIDTAALTVQALLNELSLQSAEHLSVLNHPRICVAVNQVMVQREHCLTEGDEIAFFPPVTGG
jgi:sulfur-carrier protein